MKWAIGCGYEGKVSPFNGTGKLMWKVDWPAHWKTVGITVEGAGKDHSSAGGSRDMAVQILKDVYNYPNPYDIPYGKFDFPADAWLSIRAGDIDPQHFYNAAGFTGKVVVIWSLFYDFHSLMNDEIIYFHGSIYGNPKNVDNLTIAELEKIDNKDANVYSASSSICASDEHFI